MGDETPEETRLVEFHLLSSLPDTNPIIMTREFYYRCRSQNPSI